MQRPVPITNVLDLVKSDLSVSLRVRFDPSIFSSTLVRSLRNLTQPTVRLWKTEFLASLL
jgi:hypothetical protein